MIQNDPNKDSLVDFLRKQRLLTISTVDANGNPWTSNVYYSIDNKLNLFFVSSTSTLHSTHIHNNPQVSFTTVWYDKNNLGNRVAVQGIGECKKLNKPEEIITLLKNHYVYYPLWKSMITYKHMREKLIESRPYLIKPTYMKFWNDELLGEEGTVDFQF